MFLNNIFNIVITTSLMGSVTALLILLVKGIFKDKLSPKWHYYVWLLLVLRLALPFTPSSSISIFNAFNTPSFMTSKNIIEPSVSSSNSIAEHESSLIVKQNDTSVANSQLSNNYRLPNNNISTNTINTNMSTNTIDTNTISESPMPSKEEYAISRDYFNFNTLALIWVIFFSILMAYFVICYITFIYKLNKKTSLVDKTTIDILEQCKKELEFKGDIYITLNDSITIPMAIGILKKKILISNNTLNSLSLEEKKYIFYHEINHLKNKDIILNWITTLLISIHWFNPIIWYCFKRMREECEVYCDTQTLSCLNSSERIDYGNTILKLAKLISSPKSIPGTASMIRKSEIKRRIIMISKYKKVSLIGSIMAVVLTFGIGCTSLTSSSNLPLAATVTKPVETPLEQSASNNTLASSNAKSTINAPSTNDNSKATDNAALTNTSSTPSSTTDNSSSNTKTTDSTNKNTDSKETNEIPAISDRQILELLSNGDTSVRGIECLTLKYHLPIVVVNDEQCYKLPNEVYNDSSLNSFYNKEVSLDKFFTDAFKANLKSYIVIADGKNYYQKIGNAGGNVDIKNGTITTKKVSGTSIYVEFTAKETDTISRKDCKREALLKYENGKWLIEKFDNWGIPTVRL